MTTTIISILFIISISNGDILYETEARPNWGVLFTKGRVALNGVSSYSHTYAIKIPSFTYTVITPMPCATPTMVLLHCEAINRLIASVNNATVTYIAEWNRRLDEWLASVPIIDDYTPFSTGTKRRRRRDYSVPNLCQDGIPQHQQQSPLAFIGTVAADIFRMPSWDTITTLAGHICDLSKSVSQTAEEIQRNTQALSSFVLMDNKRLTALENGMLTIESKVSGLASIMSNVTSQIYSSLNEEELKLKQMFAGANLLVDVTSNLNGYQASIEAGADMIDQFCQGINTLLSGRLSAYLVSPSTLATTLTYIGEQITPWSLRLVNSNPLFYYRLANLAYTRSRRTGLLYITVAFPVYRTGGQITTYRIDSLYLATSHNSTSSTKIVNLPDYFGLSADGLSYTEFSTAELASCRGEEILACSVERSMRFFTDMTCAAALFHDNAPMILQRCDIRFESRPQPSSAQRIASDLYLVHSNASLDATYKWETTCQAADASTTRTSIKPCQSCVYQLPCACSLLAPGEFYIPQRVAECSTLPPMNDTVPQIVTLYPISLAVVRSFYNLSILDSIRATTLTPTPNAFVIPPMTSIANEWNNTASISEQYSLDFKELARTILRNSTVYRTRADALLKVANDYTDVRAAGLADLQSQLSNLDWSHFLSGTSIVSGVSLVTLMLILGYILLIVQCIFQCKR